MTSRFHRIYKGAAESKSESKSRDIHFKHETGFFDLTFMEK